MSPCATSLAAGAYDYTHTYIYIYMPWGSTGHRGNPPAGPYDYTRSGNPTRHMLEEQMADLEGATRAFAFTSGMAALTVAMRLVPSGGHIVTGDDIYGGTSRLLSRVAPAAGITVS